MKRILKYGTGQEVPKGAIYLHTTVQEVVSAIDNIKTETARFVWHYFLVEVEEK